MCILGNYPLRQKFHKTPNVSQNTTMKRTITNKLNSSESRANYDLHVTMWIWTHILASVTRLLFALNFLLLFMFSFSCKAALKQHCKKCFIYILELNRSPLGRRVPSVYPFALGLPGWFLKRSPPCSDGIRSRPSRTRSYHYRHTWNTMNTL